MFKGKNGRYPVEVRIWAVERIRAGAPIGQVAKHIGADVSGVYRWLKNPIHPDSKRNQAENPPPEVSLLQELQQVKQALAEKVLELDFLKGALRRIEARRQKSGSSGETTSTERSKP